MSDEVTDSSASDDNEAVKLTPAQREELRKSMDSLRNLVLPKIDFPKFTISESTMKDLSAISSIANQQQAILRDAMKPLLNSASWQKQFDWINSDIFRRSLLPEASLTKITTQLYKNVDFGLSDTFATLAQQIAAQQASWIATIGPSLERIQLSFYPANLRPIKGLKWEEIESVVMGDGIALYGVPRSSIAEALIRADSAAKRREILGRRWIAISKDCRAAIESCDTRAVASYRHTAVMVLDALDAGHTEAAQALAGSLLDSMVNTYFGHRRHLYTPDKSGNRTNSAYEEFGAHEYQALAPVWRAWQKYFPDEGVPIPHTFSRNATAHTVSRKQYSRRNTLQAAMIVSGLLLLFDMETRRLERASRESE